MANWRVDFPLRSVQGTGRRNLGRRRRVFCLQIAIHGRQGAVVILEVVPHPEVDLRHQEVQVRRVRRRQRRASPTETFPDILFPEQEAVLPQPFTLPKTGDLTHEWFWTLLAGASGVVGTGLVIGTFVGKKRRKAEENGSRLA